MRKLASILLSAIISFPVLSATIPQANKFVKPVQFDQGTLCTNSSATSTQILLKPCTSGTDTVADCTTGELLDLTEASGDRLKARCFSPGTSTFAYSAFKAYLDDSVSYSDGTITTENYRGVDIRGTALAINTATSGGSGSCSGASNLISNPGFEGTTYCAREPGSGTVGACGSVCGTQMTQNPDHWVVTSGGMRLVLANANCRGGSGNCLFSPTSSGGNASTIAQKAAYENCGNASCSGDACSTGTCSGGITGISAGTLNYIILNKSQTYTLTFWVMNSAAATAQDVNIGVRAFNGTTPSDGSCGGSYTLSGIASGSPNVRTGTFATWAAGSGGKARFADEDNDGTFHQYTATITTTASDLTGVGDPFYAEISILPAAGGTPTNQFWDDFAFCSPGVSVNASATTVRALTEDQLNFSPTVTRSGDSLTIGPFIGADVTPAIAPSNVSGGSISQSNAIGVRAGVEYTADADGTYTLTQASSIVAKKPAVGTQRYGALFNWVTGWDQDADGTGVTCIADDEAQDELFADKDCDGTKDSGENYIDSGGTVTGTGSIDVLPKWTSTTGVLGDSIISADSLAAHIAGALTLSGKITPNADITYDLGETPGFGWNTVFAKTIDSGCAVGPTGRSLLLRVKDGLCSTTYTASLDATSGNFTLNTGGFTTSNTATSSFGPTTFNGTNTYTTGVFSSTVASPGPAFTFNTTNAYSTTNNATKLMSWKNNSSEKFYIDGNGDLYPGAVHNQALGDLTHQWGYLYTVGLSNGDSAFEIWGTNATSVETQRVNLTSHTATATWAFSATNLAMGSGTITGVGTPISFEAGAIDPSVTAPSSGVIGFDRDTDTNQEITDNSSGISMNPSDDGSSEWSITTLGVLTHAHTPATTGGAAYTLNQALPTGNYSGSMINFSVSPSTASTGPNGACVGGSAAGTACSSHATCTGGGECRDNSNSGDWNGFSFATAGIKGIWKTVYPVNVTFNTSLAPYVNEAAAAYFGVSLTDAGHTDRVGGTSILFDDTLASAAITTNLVYGVNIGAGSWSYGVGSSPVVGLRVEDNSAASTNVKDVAGSHGISLLNDKYYSWGAALDTAQSSRSGGIRMNGTSTMDLEIGTTVRGQVTSTGLKSNGQGVASGTGSNSHGVVLFGVRTVTDANFDTGTEVCGGNSPALTCVGTSDVLGTNIACGTAHTTIDNWLAFCK